MQVNTIVYCMNLCVIQVYKCSEWYNEWRAIFPTAVAETEYIDQVYTVVF